MYVKKDEKLIELHIGVDDVDSIYGGCTTHFAVKITWILKKRGIKFVDYPNLIRLNPSIPWKTRGNGAVALRLLVNSLNEAEDIWGLVTSELENYTSSFSDQKHQPSAVVHVGNIPAEYTWLAEKALHDIVPIDLVLKISQKNTNTRFFSVKGKRGVIGSLAAIGYTMKNTDYTYELIAYRLEENWGKPRLLEEASVRKMDELYGKYTILNYDYEYNRTLITPHGPDPVLFGIRGEDPQILIEAMRVLVIKEPIEYLAIFRTNQHTDSHIYSVRSICEIRPYTCVSAKGRVQEKPRRRVGGHVFFKICDESCCIDVGVYEPTKQFRDIVEKLEVGDEVEALGCVRPPSPLHGPTLNLEKIRVIKLMDIVKYENPKCPYCRLHMESMGRNRGFRCRKCKYRDPRATKILVTIKRDLTTGWYQPPRSAFKHLMKPIERLGREKQGFDGSIIGEFISKIV